MTFTATSVIIIAIAAAICGFIVGFTATLVIVLKGRTRAARIRTDIANHEIHIIENTMMDDPERHFERPPGRPGDLH